MASNLQDELIIKSYIPMSEASFLLLFSLDTPSHGYALMQQVALITDGRIKLGSGTVYTILSKMEKDGLIKSTPVYERRKAYQITTLGTKVLGVESDRIKQLYHILESK